MDGVKHDKQETNCKYDCRIYLRLHMWSCTKEEQTNNQEEEETNKERKQTIRNT